MDVKTCPYITVTGVVNHFNDDDHSFTMSPNQYIALPRTSSPLPINGYFVESKRWGDGKAPKILVGSTITFGGLLNRIKRNLDVDNSISSVEVEVLNVAYLSNCTTAPISPTRKPHFLFFVLYNKLYPSLGSSNRPTAPQTRWNYDDPTPRSSQHEQNVSSTSQQPSSSRPQAKRKREETCDEQSTTATDDDKKKIAI